MHRYRIVVGLDLSEYAEVVLEDELLKTLRSGATATFIVFQSPEEGIGIPVDLKGFAEGYDALP